MQLSTIEITLGFICSFSITGKLLKSPIVVCIVGFNILKIISEILVPTIPKIYFNIYISLLKAAGPVAS